MTRPPGKLDSCHGKTKYRRFTRADAAAKRMAKQFGEPMHAYHCRPCNSFHVGAHNKLPPRPEVADD